MDFGLFLEFPCGEGMTEQEAFQESFAIVDEAEALGVDSVWLAEYHFNPRRVLSSPTTIATAIAARTKRMRIGTAVQILPLGNPVRIAEEVATLDHISQGRLEFGIGRGTFPNVHEGYNVPFAESRGRFEEYLEVILKAWTSDSFSFKGEHFQCKDVCISPKPFQKPYPPIRVGITSAESFPIVGRMGYPVVINPSRVFALSELAPHIQQYRQAWQDAGHQEGPQVGLRVPVYVAESEERAYSDPKDSAMFSVHRLGERVGSYAGYTGTTGDWGEQSRKILGMDYDDWLRDKVAYGTSDMVADKLRQLQNDLELTQIIYEINFGNLLPYELQVNSMRMFNEEVIPQFKNP
jgi:alkanesulfonate monooxygenase SsuD/methylene tetrahydromethanopterin reductase-like flavin-dependent oxidoreductase (luciferase family)